MSYVLPLYSTMNTTEPQKKWWGIFLNVYSKKKASVSPNPCDVIMLAPKRSQDVGFRPPFCLSHDWQIILKVQTLLMISSLLKCFLCGVVDGSTKVPVMILFFVPQKGGFVAHGFAAMFVGWRNLWTTKSWRLSTSKLTPFRWCLLEWFPFMYPFKKNSSQLIL